jgi:hypothetical protein
MRFQLGLGLEKTTEYRSRYLRHRLLLRPRLHCRTRIRWRSVRPRSRCSGLGSNCRCQYPAPSQLTLGQRRCYPRYRRLRQQQKCRCYWEALPCCCSDSRSKSRLRSSYRPEHPPYPKSPPARLYQAQALEAARCRAHQARRVHPVRLVQPQQSLRLVPECLCSA